MKIQTTMESHCMSVRTAIIEKYNSLGKLFLNLLSIAMIKHHNQTATRGGKGLSGLQFQVTGH